MCPGPTAAKLGLHPLCGGPESWSLHGSTPSDSRGQGEGRQGPEVASHPWTPWSMWPLLSPFGQVRLWKDREEAAVMGSIPLVITLRPSSLVFQAKFPRRPLCTASPAPHPPKAVVAGPRSCTPKPLPPRGAPARTCTPEPLLEPRPYPAGPSRSTSSAEMRKGGAHPAMWAPIPEVGARGRGGSVGEAGVRDERPAPMGMARGNPPPSRERKAQTQARPRAGDPWPQLHAPAAAQRVA